MITLIDKLNFETLKAHLFGAADILRKQLNPEEYRPAYLGKITKR